MFVVRHKCNECCSKFSEFAIVAIHGHRIHRRQQVQARGASQIGDRPYRWQVNLVTVNSVTSNWWQVSVSSVTVIIYRQMAFS